MTTYSYSLNIERINQLIHPWIGLYEISANLQFLTNEKGSWYLESFSYCLWCSHGKNTEVGCHVLLPLTALCENASL